MALHFAHCASPAEQKLAKISDLRRPLPSRAPWHHAGPLELPGQPQTRLTQRPFERRDVRSTDLVTALSLVMCAAREATQWRSPGRASGLEQGSSSPGTSGDIWASGGSPSLNS